MTYERKPHQTAIGPLSSRSANVKHFIPERVQFDATARVTNALSKGRYSQADDWKNSAQRPGCQDFLRFRSHGFGC